VIVIDARATVVFSDHSHEPEFISIRILKRSTKLNANVISAAKLCPLAESDNLD